MPTVSVIVPNYNHGDHLAQRMDSILAQTFQDFEVIILDDCSTDNSRAVIESYRHHPKVVAILYNEKNSGSPFKQWESGIASASGEWLWIAESDDYSSEFFLETMLGMLVHDRNVGLVYCDSYRVVGNEVHTATFAEWKNEVFKTDRWSKRHYNDGKKEIENFLMARGTINNTSAVLFHRQTLIKAQPFDRPFRFIGDKYAFIKVLAISDVAYIELPLNYYRAAAGSAPKHSADFIDYVFEQFHVFDWISRNLPGINRHSLREALKHNTQSSMISGWNRKKIRMYADMWKINPDLFGSHLRFNMVRSFRRFTGSAAI